MRLSQRRVAGVGTVVGDEAQRQNISSKREGTLLISRSRYKCAPARRVNLWARLGWIAGPWPGSTIGIRNETGPEGTIYSSTLVFGTPAAYFVYFSGDETCARPAW